MLRSLVRGHSPYCQLRMLCGYLQVERNDIDTMGNCRRTRRREEIKNSLFSTYSYILITVTIILTITITIHQDILNELHDI